MKKIRKINCLTCGREIRQYNDKLVRIDRAHQEMWSGGVVHDLVGGYGSRHDMSGFIVCLCDDCVDNLVDAGRIHYFYNGLGGT